jgi:hypothetical protein
MHKAVRVFTIVVASAAATYAQSSQTPYAGQQRRDIKSLSPEEIDAYSNGQGMGFAKAAELNHYPGPKHVLELASELQLSEKQIEATKRILDRMHGEAVRLGILVVDKEKKLDDLFARRQIGSKRLRSAVGEIARLQGDLRSAHLRAHLSMKQLLSASQIAKYDELRGYSQPGEHKEHHHGDQ